MKNLPLCITLLLLLTCAKEDSQTPNNQPNNITPRYTLTASAGEGGSVAPTTGSFNAGTQVGITATPNAGYSFTGWSTGSTANPLTVTLNSNTSITANFALIPVYTITVSTEYGGSVSSEGGEYQQGTQVTLTATPNEGYEFSGWSDGNTEATRVITASENLTLTASFSELIISYTLTVTSQEGGSVNSEGGEYNEDTEITLTASAGEGYRFIGWSDGSTEESITITLSEDTTFEALFELIPEYTVTVTAEGGEVTGAGEYQEGTEVTLVATASEGYRFTGWSDGSTEESITITLNSDIVLTANFELIPVFTITVLTSEGGIVSTDGGQYQQGSEINISAVPDGCYNFLQWSDGNTNQERTIIAEEDIQLTAQFISLTNEVEYSLVRLRYPCAYPIYNNKDYNETEKYKASSAGWFSVSVLEEYEGYYYPTNTDYNPPGYYSMDPHNFAHGDFNNDGLQDLVITWATFTHTLERNSRYNFSILINNGDGSMTYDHDAITNSSAHYNHFAYRTKVADFNGDGLDDIVSASMGVIQRLPGQDPYTRWERIPLLLNIGNGKFIDASYNIEGQEDGISPPVGHSFGHEIDVGDVDGDGDIDIYTGKILLINDGSGNFSNKTSELASELKPWGRNLWSSVVSDFNNDGIEDFFVPYAEIGSNSQYANYSGVYSLSNNGNPSYKSTSDIGFVSEAKYGLSNSKFNYAIDYDINLDGYKDIVIAVTRASPYYVGKGLQVFLNVFDPDTGNRKFISGDYLLPDESILDQYHGEGQLSVIDINNDGILDIAHTSGAYGNEYGLSFYINNNGTLELFDQNNFAYLSQEQIPGRENFGVGNKLRRAIPVNLDYSGWVDYISIINLGFSSGRNENVLYSVLAKD